MHQPKFGVSQSVTRKEDDALIRGHGRYVADVAPPGALHAVMLRSPHAHARFAVTDIAVRALPGVRLVLTAPDIATLGPLPCVAIPEASRSTPRFIRCSRLTWFVTSATPSPSSSPTPSSRRRTPPRRSRSIGSRCPTWSARSMPSSPARHRYGRSGPVMPPSR